MLLSACLGAATPCLWDHDTLAQERHRFPSVLELITGRFPRHSSDYYRWRIADREGRLAAGEQTPPIYDDLAVAHSKLGNDARAIEIMAAKEALFPGLYETEANLGTFHLHAGHLERGLEHIARAIEINPEAHFGREVYQEFLGRYLLARRGEQKSTPLPLQAEPISVLEHPHLGYWDCVLRERNVSRAGHEEELQRALRGVTGMLRFGNHDSPILLEVLSDLLLADQARDAKRLAARALLRASYLVGEEDALARDAYRAKARAAIETQTPSPGLAQNISLEQVEETFAVELADSEQWWAELEARERYWIAQGDDVDGRFADIYYGPKSPVPDQGRQRYRAVAKYGFAIAIALGVIAMVYTASLARH